MDFGVHFMLRLKMFLGFSFNEHLKMHTKVKKDEFDVAVGCLLDGLIGGALECAPRHALSEPCKDAHEAVIKL